MKALILAGGLGTRLSAVVPHLPKPMAIVNKRPFLEYLLDYWINQGVDEFYLSVHHLANKIKDHFGSSYKNRPITYLQEPKLLGTGGAILFSLSQFLAKDEDILILNGDTFVEVDLKEMLDFHQRCPSSMTIALRSIEQNDRYSGVEIDSNNQLIQFAERKKDSSYLLINAGVYLVKPEFFCCQKWQVGEVFSLEDHFFPEVIKEKNRLFGFVINGRFIDIGIPTDYQRAESFFNYV